MIRSTSAAALAQQRLEDRAVLAVDRDQPRPVRRAGPPQRAPRRRPGSPCWRAPARRRARASRSPGASPAAPTIADIAQSTGSDAAASSASGPAAAAMPLPQRQLELGEPVRVGRDRDLGLEPHRLPASSSTLPAPVSATTWKVSAPPSASIS